ncbi:MAG: HPr family phosphocarrier protein [Spirochaetota bacterium]
MKTIELTVRNETGLHSRPADLFVRTAKLYQSTVTVQKGEKMADAKNIIKVILLNVSQGNTISIHADGPDEDAVLVDLKTLVESDFSEINDKVRI